MTGEPPPAEGVVQQEPQVAAVAAPDADDMEVDMSEATEDEALTGEFTWTVENFTKVKQLKLYSPVFQSGQYNWRILLFPHGNNVQQLSVYLDVADSVTLPQGWSRQAHFSLTVQNQKDPSKSVVKDADHHFTLRACDWGFREFVQLHELREARSGFIVDDKIIISARVRVEPQVNWWNWDSKRETGYVGLKNQGATCYMNSLLQTLTHLPYFRKAVYHMHTTDGEDPESSIPLALQRIFYKLQHSDSSVSTKELTKSFGWDTYDTFMQHDVQELNRVLVEKLEEKMKGTSVEGTMEHLFRGKFTNYVSCINVDDKSLRDEEYYDLQMPVKGCKDLYASLDEYVKEELLDGDNQYHSDTYGKQDAKKGVRFKSLPPVLELHLRRFEYDFTTDSMAKINERFEFPTVLDMDREGRKYFTDEADPSVKNLYKLHSVLVHSGGPNGGHYYAFIRPLGVEQWYRFDDERVTKVKEKEAVEHQFGGLEHQQHPGHTPQWKYPKISSAYMLVYVRESAIDQINVDVTSEDVAAHLRHTLEMEQAEKQRKKKERLEAHLYTVVRVATRDDLRKQIGDERFFDLVDHESCACIRIKKEHTLLQLKQDIWRLTGVRPTQQRLWMWAKRQNHTFRPDRPLQLDYDDHVAMMDVKEDHPPPAGRFQAEIRLYLEPVGADGPLEAPPEGASAPEEEGYPTLGPNELLLFLKFYSPQGESLGFVGTHVAMMHHTLDDLLPVLRAYKGLPPDQELAVFEEVEFETSVRFEPIAHNKTLKDCELQSGDILCFQTHPPPHIAPGVPGGDLEMTPADGAARTDAVRECEREPLLSIPQFFEHVKNRAVVHLHKLPAQQHHGNVGVREKERALQIAMDKRWSYDQVTARIGAELGAKPERLRLTMHNPYSDLPKPQPIKYRGVDTLMEMLTSFQKSTDQLFYEVLDIPLQEYEAKKSLKVSWHNSSADEVQVLSLLLDKEATVAHALEELAKIAPTEKKEGDGPTHPLAPGRRLRMMEVFNHRIYKIFSETDEIDAINDQYWTIRAEETAPEEESAGPEDKLVHARHFYRDTRMNMTHNFGDPFLLLLGAEETTVSVRTRVQAKLGLSDEEIAKWRLAVVSFGRVEYLEDHEVVKQRFRKHDNYGNWDDYLGLEHAQVPGTGRKKHAARTGYADKPVKIYG